MKTYNMPLTEREMQLAEKFDEVASSGYLAKEVGHAALCVYVITLKDRGRGLWRGLAALAEAWCKVK
jgi:hypothetical protein